MTDDLLPGCRLVPLTVRGDARGSLVALEGGRDLPFAIARVYYEGSERLTSLTDELPCLPTIYGVKEAFGSVDMIKPQMFVWIKHQRAYTIPGPG